MSENIIYRKSRLDLIINNKTHHDTLMQRELLARIADFPQYADTETHTSRTIKINGTTISITSDVKKLLDYLNVKTETLPEFSEQIHSSFKRWHSEIEDRLREKAGISLETKIYHQGSIVEYDRNAKEDIWYIRIELQTEGTSKRIISKIHKENMSNLMKLLKQKNQQYRYDCTWEFTGTKKCKL